MLLTKHTLLENLIPLNKDQPSLNYGGRPGSLAVMGSSGQAPEARWLLRYFKTQRIALSHSFAYLSLNHGHSCASVLRVIPMPTTEPGLQSLLGNLLNKLIMQYSVTFLGDNISLSKNFVLLKVNLKIKNLPLNILVVMTLKRSGRDTIG